MKNILQTGVMAASLLATGPALAHEVHEQEMDQQVLKHERRMRKTHRDELSETPRSQPHKRKRARSRDSGFGALED